MVVLGFFERTPTAEVAASWSVQEQYRSHALEFSLDSARQSGSRNPADIGRWNTIPAQQVVP